MIRDFSDIREIIDFAKNLEVYPQKGEPERHFRVRVSEAVLDMYKDSILASEIVLGKDSKEWNEEEKRFSLRFHKEYTESNKQKLEMLNDTHFNMSWKYLEDILLGRKFEKVHSYNFMGREGDKEELAVWVEKTNALFLPVDSTTRHDGEKYVNSVTLYYELALPGTLDELNVFQRCAFDDVVNRCQCYGSTDAPGIMGKTFFIHFDAREGLFKHIDALQDSGFKTNNPWQYYKKHSLWLCDYMETKAKSYDWKAITEEKVRELPEDIQKMIGYKK